MHPFPYRRRWLRARGGVLLAAALVAGPAFAQPVMKCLDAAGNVTYQNSPCEKGQATRPIEMPKAENRDDTSAWETAAHDGQVVVGMPKRWVLRSRGTPAEIRRGAAREGASEVWRYGETGGGSLLVGFNGEQVVWVRSDSKTAADSGGTRPTRASAPPPTASAPAATATAPPPTASAPAATATASPPTASASAATATAPPPTASASAPAATAPASGAPSAASSSVAPAAPVTSTRAVAPLVASAGGPASARVAGSAIVGAQNRRFVIAGRYCEHVFAEIGAADREAPVAASGATLAGRRYTYEPAAGDPAMRTIFSCIDGRVADVERTLVR